MMNNAKGYTMQTSSATTASSTQIEAMKKAMQVQEQQVLKILEGQDKQAKVSGAHLSGLGMNLNVTA